MTNADDWDFSSIPGTLVYGGELARAGYPVNNLCRSLLDPGARERFAQDPDAYMQQLGLSDAQREAVTRRDWKTLQALGGNVYYLAKLAGALGVPLKAMSAAMADMTLEEFEAMLASGGRKPHG